MQLLSQRVKLLRKGCQFISLYLFCTSRFNITIQITKLTTSATLAFKRAISAEGPRCQSTLIGKQLPVIILLFLCKQVLVAQPYIDVAIARATFSPSTGAATKAILPIQYFQYTAGLLAPITLHDSSKILIGIYNEGWDITSKQKDDLTQRVQSLLVPVSYIKPLSKKWTITGAVIPRWNGEAGKLFKNSFQLGGTLLTSYRKNSSLVLRAGIFYNSEFFGAFVIPLAGLDWKMSDRDNLFGLLPQQLVYEHKLSKRFYCGATYRMFNNTYRAGGQGTGYTNAFIRINEMQLMLSADVYLTKKLVLNMEGGHSVLRQMRLGTDERKKNYYLDLPVKNGFVFKTGLLYRIRFR